MTVRYSGNATLHGNANPHARRRPDPDDWAQLDDDALLRHVKRYLSCSWRMLYEALGVSYDTLMDWRRGRTMMPDSRRRRLLALRGITLTDSLFIVSYHRASFKTFRRRPPNPDPRR